MLNTLMLEMDKKYFYLIFDSKMPADKEMCACVDISTDKINILI